MIAQQAPAAEREPSLLERAGGGWGLAQANVPAVVFVAADIAWPLATAIVLAVAASLVLVGVRALRRQTLGPAVGSLVGVALAAGITAWTGSGRDFFVVGIVLSVVSFVGLLGSVLVRRPATGAAWNALHGGKHAWRADRAVLRAHDLATLAGAAVAGSRATVQLWLYLSDDTTGLGVARIVMGFPLTVLAMVAVVWAFRRSTARLVTARR